MKKKAGARFNKAKERSDAESILWGGLKSLALSIALLSALLLAGAAVAMSTNDPDSLCAPLGYLSIAITLWLSGMFSAKFCKQSASICALSTGSLLAIIAFGVCIALGNGNGGASQFVFLAFPIVSLLGSLLASGKKSKTRRKFKNH